jgi:hypothetical protein
VVNDTTSEGGGDQIATIAMPVRNVAQAVASGQLSNSPGVGSNAQGLPRVHDDQSERGQMGTQLMSHAALRQAGANIPTTHRSGAHSRPNIPTGSGVPPAAYQSGSHQLSLNQPQSGQQPSNPQSQGGSPLAQTRPDTPAAPAEGGDLTTVYRRGEKASGPAPEAPPSKLPMVLGVILVALLGFAIAAVLLQYFQTGRFFWEPPAG